jgi:DNA-binding CsgD family transcriptional regulator
VVAVERWDDPASDYVVIREPMLITVFATLFDLAWETAYPIRPMGAAGAADGPLLDLLSRGLKDEAIARHLGWSLRTVRRRVAGLMDDVGARTRFQLGAEAVRAGRLESGPPASPAGPKAYRGRLGARTDSR